MKQAVRHHLSQKGVNVRRVKNATPTSSAAAVLGGDKVSLHPARVLRAHPSHVAQRPIVLRKAMEIAKAFDPALVTEVQAAHLAIQGDVGLWLLDGRNRCAGVVGHDLLKLGMGEKDVARMLLEHDANLDHVYPEGVGTEMVRVAVHTKVQTEAEAAAKFLGLNSSAKVNIFVRFENGIIAGFPRETRISEILAAQGLRVSASVSKGTMACPAALYQSYALDDNGTVLAAALSAVIAAWGRIPNAFDGAIIKGVSLFCHQEQPHFEKLVRALRRWQCSEVLPAALGLYKSHSVDSVAEGVVDRIKRKYSLRSK